MERGSVFMNNKTQGYLAPQVVSPALGNKDG